MRRITPVMALTLALLVGAGVLAAIQLFLLELHLAALSVLLLAAALGGLVWKLQVSAVTSKKLERQISLLTSRVSQPAPVTSQPALEGPVAAAPVAEPPERSTTEKLRSVGTFTPAKAAAESVSGRLAARVSTDPDAPFRLFAATNGYGAPDATAVSRRALAVIGGAALVDALDGVGSVHRIHPSVSAAELEHAQPTALVIEEDALDSGPWVGALDPHGAKLLMELRVAMAWTRRHGGSVFVLPSRNAPGLAAGALRADCVLIDDEFAIAQADAPPSLPRTLVSYRQETGR